MSSAKADKLARMANQIGAAFQTMSTQDAVTSAAMHLRLYWTPKMIREIIALADIEPTSLNPIAAGAVAALKTESVG